jgi:hypothetical protein
MYANWQNTKRDDRLLWKLNGSPIVEIDYSAIHPRILYALEDKIPPDDPYSFAPPGLDAEHARTLSKMAIQMMLNTSSRHGATIALNNWQVKEYGEIIHPSKEIIQGTLRVNSDIQCHFFQGDVGVRLQNIDSAIAMTILEAFIAQGTPILILHDSFMVPKDAKGFLYDTMMSAFKTHTGAKAKLTVKEYRYPGDMF